MPTQDETPIGQILEAILTMRGELNARLDKIDAKLTEAASERQAIRDVVDTLPSYDQVADLELQAAGTKRELASLKNQSSHLVAELRRAGLKV